VTAALPTRQSFDFWQFDNNGPGGSQVESTTAAATISPPVIQTDAAINPGNPSAKAPRLQCKGHRHQCCGIASAGKTSAKRPQSGSIGVGFAIPANLAQRVANEIIKNGKGKSHGLGWERVFRISRPRSAKSTVVGASIKEITGGGAADKAGLKSGDVITTFNGTPITGVLTHRPGASSLAHPRPHLCSCGGNASTGSM
jgi:putative serine protease PepD